MSRMESKNKKITYDKYKPISEASDSDFKDY